MAVALSHRRIESLGVESLQDGYERQTISPVDVVHAVYDRIDEYADKAVWITVAPRAGAVAYAQHLVTQFEGKPRPPLYGVPFSVKDNIDVAAYPTTVACPGLAYTATHTAPVVQRLLDAGAIFIGKTNLDQFATGLVGHRSPFGTPRCVYDPDYISGGSSSGSAVSVAANLVTFTVATDTGGSGRIPAALNGVVGLKPTHGTLSTVGVVPAVRTADCVAVIAKSVEDAKVAWRIMKGYDAEDIYARHTLPVWPRLWPRGSADDPLRFGVPSSDELSKLSPAYSHLFDNVLDGLTKSMHLQKSSSFDYSPFAAANDMLFHSSVVAQRLASFNEYTVQHGFDDLHPVVRDIFSSGADYSAKRAYADIFTLRALKRAAEVQFRDNIDVLVVPSTVHHFTVAEIEEEPVERNNVLGTFAYFVNLLDLCAVAVPAGVWRNEKGLVMPFGVTLIAQAGRDEDVFELGRRAMEFI
ncbi:putative glutamyl-tRNA amidotransferase subunit A [Thozetella sp. PMI_491]|nr:putative glutamyl-tRNA amidotransferase subunit A [Thozetella sp. PMI_491]